MSVEAVSSTPSLLPALLSWPAWLPWLVCVVAVGVALPVRAGWLSVAWTRMRNRDATRPTPFTLELLIADRGRRRALEGELRTALARLQLLLGPTLPAHTSVIVQDTICQDGGLAGCTHLGEREAGAYAIVRLALRVREQELSADQVLAVLVEQCLALAARRDEGATVVLPVELPFPPVRSGHGASTREAASARAELSLDPLAAPTALAPLASYGDRDGLTRTRRAG